MEPRHRALEALNDLKRQVHAGHLEAASGTFTDILWRWLEVESARWKATTCRRNRDIVERLVVPALGESRPITLARRSWTICMPACETPGAVKPLSAGCMPSWRPP